MTKSADATLVLRLERALLDRVDADALAAGVTRSVWMRALIVTALAPAPAPISPRESHDLSLRRVYCGVPSELLARVDAEAQATGLRRNVFIRRVLHAHCYEGERLRVMSHHRDKQFAELKKKLSKLEKMVNTVERAVKAIERDKKFHEYAIRVDELIEMHENIIAAFKTVQSFVTWVTFEDHRYWRRGSADSDFAMIRENFPAVARFLDGAEPAWAAYDMDGAREGGDGLVEQGAGSAT